MIKVYPKKFKKVNRNNNSYLVNRENICNLNLVNITENIMDGQIDLNGNMHELSWQELDNKTKERKIIKYCNKVKVEDCLDNEEYENLKNVLLFQEKKFDVLYDSQSRNINKILNIKKSEKKFYFETTKKVFNYLK